MKAWKKITTVALSALLCMATVANASDLYLDLNGTTAGFGVNSAASPITVDFTNAVWNTDPSGGAGGSFVVAGTNDVLNFGLEGADGILFNWQNYGDLVVGGINQYRPDTNDTATVNRFQKPGGGFLTFQWGTNATWTVDEMGGSMWWDLGSVGDFEKLGSKWITLGDGGPKINGTCTISEGYIVVNKTGTVDANSNFKLIPNGLRFKDNIDDVGATTANVGILSGSGSITRDGSGSALGNLTVQAAGVDMGDDAADDEISFGWGSTITFSGTSTNTFDIAKTDGTNYLADVVRVDWNRPVTLGGDLAVKLASGSEALAEGDTFQILNKNVSASFVGSFSSFDLPPLSGGLIWSTTALTSNGTITVVSPAAGPPAAPTGLAVVTTGVYSVSLDWNDNTDLDLSGYKVYRSETPGTNDLVEIASLGLVSEYVDTSADPNDSTYYYSVTALDTDTNESDLSNQTNAFLGFALGNGDFETPALASGGTTIDASGHWTQVGSQQGIQKADWAAEEVGGQGAWLKGWNVTVTNSFYQDKEAVPGSEYTLDAGVKIGAGFRANGGQIEMSLVWLNGSSAEISRNTLDVDAAIATDGSFVHTNIAATAPGNAAFVRSLFYWTTTTNANVDGTGDKSSMVDNVSLVKGGQGDLFAAWTLSFGLSGSPDADPDYDYEGDGMDNLLEYALGGNPTNDDAAVVLPEFSTAPAGDWFYYVHNQRTDDSSLTFTVKRNDSLVFGSWTNSGVEFVGESGVVDSFKSVTNRTDIDSAEFLRLEVEQN